MHTLTIRLSDRLSPLIYKVPISCFFTQSIKFLLKPIGVLATGSLHARPFARPPIDMSGNSYPKLQNHKTTFVIFVKPKKRHRGLGGEGGPYNNPFCDLSSGVEKT